MLKVLLEKSHFLIYMVATLLLGAIWKMCSLICGPEVLPDPLETFLAFQSLCFEPEFIGHFYASLSRLLLSLLVASAIADRKSVV